MNKQINSINGYSCMQAQVKMQLNFQNVINARVTCLRTHFIPPPPHPKILYETLLALKVLSLHSSVGSVWFFFFPTDKSNSIQQLGYVHSSLK